jgi:hypothetical protein
MPDTKAVGNGCIPEHLMLSRLTRSEQMREFFIQMWLQNPMLAERAGKRVRELLSPVAGGANPTTGAPQGRGMRGGTHLR